MGKQTRSKKSESTFGKGKVTPVQVAYIVDRYLYDNNFVHTRTNFRSEASHIAKLPVELAPRTLMTLGDMLDDYICLKEQKVILDHEKTRLEQEKFRIQTLLRGMQDVMHTYSNGGASASAAAPLPSPVVMPSLPAGTTMASPAANFPAYSTPVMMSTSRPSTSLSEPTNFSTPTTSQPSSKRKNNSKDVCNAPVASKRTRSQLSANQQKSSGSVKAIYQPILSSNNHEPALQITPVPSISQVSPATKPSPLQGSSVAKCLFNPSSNSPGPQTPSPSPIDKSVSPTITHTPLSSNKKIIAPQQFTSSNRTVITSETIHVSPSKQVSYYSIERNHCISSPMKTSSKRFGSREHVKGRLDFDGSETADVNSGLVTSDENSGSPSDEDAFDFDLPNLDFLGVDFNLTELLGDFDDFGQPDNGSGSSPESLSGSPDKTVDGGTNGDHELLSEKTSTVTEVTSEQDLNISGPNSVTTVKSVTKSIKVFSPVKSRKT